MLKNDIINTIQAISSIGLQLRPDKSGTKLVFGITGISELSNDDKRIALVLEGDSLDMYSKVDKVHVMIKESSHSLEFLKKSLDLETGEYTYSKVNKRTETTSNESTFNAMLTKLGLLNPEKIDEVFTKLLNPSPQQSPTNTVDKPLDEGGFHIGLFFDR